MIVLFTILLIGSFFLRSEESLTDDDYVSPPAEVADVIESHGNSIEGSQETTLRWIADAEDFLSVNLAAQSYGLGFMKKSVYENIESSLLLVTTREAANDADSDLAGQKGFRASGRACIIGYTYSNSVVEDIHSEATDREVYGIIVCSRG